VRYAETEAFVAKARAVLRAGGPGASPEWIEEGLRDALRHDGRRLIAVLPDDEEPLPFETIHRNRSRSVETLFGAIEWRRNYHHHVKSGTGRVPTGKPPSIWRPTPD